LSGWSARWSRTSTSTRSSSPARCAAAHYLTGWLDEKKTSLVPNTVRRYRDYLTKDLIPAFGAIRLERLTHVHITYFITQQQAADR
jgi:hypothetical protein